MPISKARSSGKRLGLLQGRFKAMTLEELNASDEAVAALFGGQERG